MNSLADKSASMLVLVIGIYRLIFNLSEAVIWNWLLIPRF